MPRLAVSLIVIALLLTVVAPAYAAERAGPPEPPAWQLPMLAGAGGLALGMLVGRRRGLGRCKPDPLPPTSTPHPGIDAPTERGGRLRAERGHPSYRLVVWAGAGRIVHELRERQCVLGRDPGCDVQIDGPQVAALHARVSLLGDRVLLSDLGSAGGTFLTPGGAPLGADQPAELHDGDTFWLGPEVRVVLRRADEE